MYEEELKLIKDIYEDLEAKRDEVFHLECTLSTLLQKMDKDLGIVTVR